MKMKLTTIGSVLSLFLGLSSAHAITILQEDFNSYSNGSLTNVSGEKWIQHSGTGSGIFVVNYALQISSNLVDDVNSALISAPYASDGPVAALYARFTVNVSTLPAYSGAYFAHFKDGGNNFRCRVWAGTNGPASGSYRLGIANSSGTPTYLSTDLSPGTTYTVVTRYALATGIATIWLAPANETAIGIDGTDTPAISYSAAAYAFRQDSAEGILTVDDLVVGTKFADVVPGSAGSNPPFITLQPGNTNIAAGTTINLSVVAGGDETLAYQWYKNDWPLGGATESTYVKAPSTTGDTGSYYARVTNSIGAVYSRTCSVQVAASPIAPTITSHPQSTNLVYGDSTTFAVSATGTEPISYQWQFYETNLPGATAASYTVYRAYASNAGPYQVIVTNDGGAATSYVATLTVGPPAVRGIASVRAMCDPDTYVPTNTTSLFTVEGIVTSWANLTSAGNNSLFYLQDATAGMAVFWTGGFSSNTPPAGARVRVTAPLSHYRGLLEMYPLAANATHSVTVISTNNPLPAALPIPFDAATQANPVAMEALEGSYVVASNIFLNTSSATFVSVSAGEYITNNASETFLMYINSYTDVPGQVKPTGPVTIFGVLGQFDTSSPYTSGYQLIPTRYADVISQAKAATVRFTNNIANQIRSDGFAVNTVSENVLRLGETLTMDILATDPDGGTVTITPLTVGLPASAGWSTGPVTGTRVASQFHFSPTSGDAGVNYTISLKTVTSTAVATNKWYVYVPTPVEQQVFISEILANPTMDSSSPAWNPLHRTEMPTADADIYDEYIEVVNLSGTDIDLLNWSISDAVKMRHKFYSGAPAEALGAQNAIVIYGGPLNGNQPSLPVLYYPASEGSPPGLALNNTGSETITLRNAASNVVDHVLYTGGNLSSSYGVSISRWPTVNDGFVPQVYISTNTSSAGLQFDGKAWNEATTTTTGVTGATLQAGNPLQLSFTAAGDQMYTLWSAPSVTDTFVPVKGATFSNTAGAFYITNPPPSQYFYFITKP